MSFADEVTRQLPDAKKCKLCTYVHSLDVKERADVKNVLADKDFASTAIGKALRQRGLTISDSTIQRCRTNHGI